MIKLFTITTLTIVSILPHSQLRTSNAVCTKIQGDYTYFTTTDGNEWSVIDDSYALNEKYKITFDTQNTKTLYDDIIVSITNK